MSEIRSVTILIELPENWTVVRGGDQTVAHGPDHVKVTSTSNVLAISKSMAKEALEDIRLKLVDNVRLSVANNDELKILAEHPDRNLASGLSLTEVRATDGTNVIMYFTIASRTEVSLVTYVGPVAASEAQNVFQMAIESAKLIEEPTK